MQVALPAQFAERPAADIRANAELNLELACKDSLRERDFATGILAHDNSSGQTHRMPVAAALVGRDKLTTFW